MKTTTQVKENYQNQIEAARKDLRSADIETLEKYVSETGRAKEQELEARIKYTALDAQVEALREQLEAVTVLRLEAQYDVQLIENKIELTKAILEERK